VQQHLLLRKSSYRAEASDGSMVMMMMRRRRDKGTLVGFDGASHSPSFCFILIRFSILLCYFRSMIVNSFMLLFSGSEPVLDSRQKRNVHFLLNFHSIVCLAKIQVRSVSYSGIPCSSLVRAASTHSYAQTSQRSLLSSPANKETSSLHFIYIYIYNI
jgi:hypothetical protein